jgi:hypothetical protein
MSKHTPGPWVVTTRNETKCVRFLIDGTYFKSRDETAANAALMSAAPDMLEALIQLRRSLYVSGEIQIKCASRQASEDLARITTLINDAIAKAEGKL